MKKSLLLLAGALVAGASAANAATVYFDNSDNWSEVYVYTWTGNENNHAWPGEAVTETVTSQGKTYYKYESNFAQIIFNNNDKTQTKDCNVVDNMIYNPSGATGSLFGGGSVEIVPECFLAYEGNGWSASNEADKFTNSGNGVFTLTKDSFDEEFKIVYDGQWLGYIDGVMESGVAYPVSETGYSNCALSGAATNVTFVYDANANTLKVTYTTNGDVPTPPTPPVSDIPSKLYLIGGEIDGSSWNPAQAVEMTKDGNVFSCTANVKGVAEGICYFSFLTAIGEGSEEDPWAVANNADRYGATVADAPIELGGSSEFVCYPVNVSASSAASWALTVGEELCDFKVDFTTMMVTVTKSSSTGVAAIEAEESPVYFNLQGVKVAEPSNGIYVKVVNGKASKVMINK
ncbi:MAG: starch-binding protein [Muribaculaceae bacterium]|nr:starch-binding protein [Muribaculaceae bacterium]